MGRGTRAGKTTKQAHTIRRDHPSISVRTIKRDELDIIGSICGTNRNQVGKVSQETSEYEQQNDVRTECIERERSSGSGSTATAESDERDSPSNHRL